MIRVAKRGIIAAPMARLVRFFKPYGVLSQFRKSDQRPTLADYIDLPGVHPAGRLDFDSEGLLLLTDDGRLQSRITDPRHKLEKSYLVQVLVEATTDSAHWRRIGALLRNGVELADGPSRASAFAHLARAPALPPRHPPVVERHARTSTWLRVGMRSGRNREVRRLCAAVGHPVLRLVRVRVGPFGLDALAPGEWSVETVNLPAAQSSRHAARRR
jgi:23S rRNA pseudouridine2457 synthase